MVPSADCNNDGAPDLHGESFDTDAAFEVFHENSKYWRVSRLVVGYRIARFLSVPRLVAQVASCFKRYDAPPHFLAEPETTDLSLIGALQRRQSATRFADSALSSRELSALLTHALSCSRPLQSAVNKAVTIFRRPYPSGGALYPIEFYLLAMAVDGLKPGVYHFDPRARALRCLREAPRDELMHPLEALEHQRHASAVIVMTAIFRRSTIKYGNRGYRFALIESGHAAQNVALMATALGLGSLSWGAYFDDELNTLLGIDGVSESVVNTLFIGAVP